MATTVSDLSGLLKGIPAGVWVAISEQQNERLSRLANFRGYGDYKNSRFLYIGIEEGKAHTGKEELDKFLAGSPENGPWQKTDPNPPPPKNITERMQARLSMELLEKIGELQEGTPVDEYAFTKKDEFCANINPFGANSEKIQPRQYPDLLVMDKEDAQKHIESERKVIIKNMIECFISREGGRVFIFGKKASDFLDRHKILEELNIQISNTQIKFEGKKPSPIRHSTDFKVWLTGHPSWRWFDEKAIKEIIKTIPMQSVCKKSA